LQALLTSMTTTRSWAREVTFTRYITSAAFAENAFENWESEFLRIAVYVVLTALSYQRGSADPKTRTNARMWMKTRMRTLAIPRQTPRCERVDGCVGCTSTLFRSHCSFCLLVRSTPDCEREGRLRREVAARANLYDGARVPWKLEVLVRVVSELAGASSFRCLFLWCFRSSAGEGFS
jgi:hypothetical protein